MSENLETMETIGNDEVEVIDKIDYADAESGSGKVIGLVVAVLTGAGALGAVAYKKYKANKEGKPKKKRRKLMLVEVDDEVDSSDVIEFENEEIEEEKVAEE